MGAARDWGSLSSTGYERRDQTSAPLRGKARMGAAGETVALLESVLHLVPRNGNQRTAVHGPQAGSEGA